MKSKGTHQTKQTTVPSKDDISRAMDRAVARVQRMSHEEQRRSLIEAGIMTASGKLAAAYR